MNYKEINTDLIKNKVAELFYEANHSLGDDVRNAVCSAEAAETDALARSVLGKLTDNMDAAKELDIPVCQDTGFAVVFIELGQEVILTGEPLPSAVNAGVRKAYLDGKMRCSVVKDPLFDRENTGDNTPAVIYTDIVPGDSVKITVAPKGFGSENMSRLKMFTPAATAADVANFVVDCVKTAGGNPCPPIVVGVGIGGTADFASVLAKKALLRKLGEHNPDVRYAELEQTILEKINSTGIGPQGFGGDTTAFAVNIEKYPTHIAGLPVAVNISCHVLRHKSAEIK